MVSLIQILLICCAWPFQPDDNPKIEVYIFNDRCIPIEHLTTNESFYELWYHKALEYKPKGVPIFTPHDVIEFDTVSFEMKVSEQAWKHLNDIAIPSFGIPVFLVVNGEVAYGAWLWSPMSSQTCGGVSLQVHNAGEERKLLINQADSLQEMRIPASIRK